MKVHVQFIEVGNHLRVLLDQEFDLTSGHGLPVVGDRVHIFDKTCTKQFWVVERHWNIGNVIGIIEIFVAPTSEQARTI
jgi:hypothetical protein